MSHPGFAFPDDLATPTGKETNAKLHLAALRYSLNAAKSGSWEVWSVVRWPLLIPGHASTNLLKRQPAKFVDERLFSAQVLVASMVCSRPSLRLRQVLVLYHQCCLDRVGSASVYWGGLLCA